MLEKKEFLTTIERQAAHYFSKGFNCCQSILLAANDIWELNLDQAIIASGRFFQHGMGCGSTCGALIGAHMVLGILDNRYETKLSNKYARKLSEEFNQTFGTTQCSELRKKQSIMDKIGYKGCKRITFMTAGVFYEFWESTNGNQTPSVGHYSDVK
ncbi:C-GCAxxG-C-C family protein [Desulfosporosinus nitroreducens]|uniref:C-GCAxxG-C-C family protein n=1 Tax=Desulfosporosinus nitroreducens TaxID=2018668 RepID=UPI00207D1665|nr:C-GCAxxG-C-C family protein [Desulfosporosinus nitroreducens]MCO1601947.1 C-GCAxxG-C-C family protein [Desulfosporosinus nitroreducens]